MPKLQRSLEFAKVAAVKGLPKSKSPVLEMYGVYTSARSADPGLYVVFGASSAVNYTLAKLIGVSIDGKRIGAKALVGD